MNIAGVCYLGFTVLLWVVFAAIVLRTYSPKLKAKGEQPKYRMMDDD
jgi:hypothetical protein